MGKARNIADLLNSSGKIDSADIDSSAQFYQFKNRIINGDCRLDQRNAGASVTITNTGANTYTLDRWFAYGSAASKFSVQQDAGAVTPPTGFNDYLGVTSLAATSLGSTDQYVIGQFIEGFNSADLAWGTANAATVTMSFWVRSSLTGTFGGVLRNSGFNRSYPFSYTINAANTWEQKSITIVGDTAGTWLTTNGVGIGIYFGLGVGSSLSGTAGSWSGSNFTSVTGATSVVGTNGATLYITGVQLEKGSTATSFDYRPYGTELQLCQRYFCKSFDMALQPSTVNVKFNCSLVNGNTFADSFSRASFNFPVVMRSAPTVVTYSGSTTGQVRYLRNTGATVDGSQGGITPLNEITFVLNGSYGGSGSNSDIRSIFFDYTASAEL